MSIFSRLGNLAKGLGSTLDPFGKKDVPLTPELKAELEEAERKAALAARGVRPDRRPETSPGESGSAIPLSPLEQKLAALERARADGVLTDEEFQAKATAAREQAQRGPEPGEIKKTL